MPSIERVRRILSLSPAAAARGTVMLCGILAFLAISWFVFWRVRIVALTADGNPYLLVDIAGLVQNSTGAAFCLLGSYVAAKARERAGVWVLALYLIAQGLATGYLNSIIALFGFADGRTQFARLLINGLAYAAAMRATQLFPGPLSAAEVTMLIRPGRPTRPLWQLVRWLLVPWRPWALAAGLLLLVPLTPSDLLFHLGQLAILILAVATLTANYLTGDAGERRKIYWLLAGALILLLARFVILAGSLMIDWLGVPGVTNGAPTGAFSTVVLMRLFVWTLAVVAMMICILLAIFYRGAINPEMVVRRTAVFSAGFGLLFFVFGVFVNYLSAIVVQVLALEENLVQAVAATLIALSFRPLDKWLTCLTDRYLPKQLDVVANAADVVDDDN